MTVKLLFVMIGAASIAVALAGCAEPRGPVQGERATAIQVGSAFNLIGTVSLHAGQPCTPQIMFDFQPAKTRSTIWLAAPMHETTMLTDAAKRHRRVRIAGNWHRGKGSDCTYVEVSSVESAK